MDLLAIVVVGLVASAYMFGFEWAAVRLGLLRGGLIRAVGSLVIPEPVRSTYTQTALNFLVGIVFAGVYAYIFGFLRMEGGLPAYLEIGALIGLVHGFFVSYFLTMGFSALQKGDEVQPFHFSMVVLNALAHVLFGVMVGFGLGQAAMGRLLPWAAYTVGVGVVLGAVFLVLVPRRLHPQVHVEMRRRTQASGRVP